MCSSDAKPDVADGLDWSSYPAAACPRKTLRDILPLEVESVIFAAVPSEIASIVIYMYPLQNTPNRPYPVRALRRVAASVFRLQRLWRRGVGRT